MLKVITFDFWDTLVVDNSDEIERKARGLHSKGEARTALFLAELQAHTSFSEERIREAYEHANQWYVREWKQEHRTPSVAVRFDQAYAHLQIERTPGFDKLVQDFEEMEVKIPPALADGVSTMLATLAKTYTLGIISDTIITPGTGLRQILKDYGLYDHFSFFVFSDEAEAAKPAERVFALASEYSQHPYSELLHVGDREANDIAGPHRIGMRSILYTGVIDRGTTKTTQATAVCRHHDEMPALLQNIQQDA